MILFLSLSLMCNNIVTNHDFQAKQRNLEGLVREADDTIKSLKERLDTAENLIEDGNKLLKQYVNKMSS